MRRYQALVNLLLLVVWTCTPIAALAKWPNSSSGGGNASAFAACAKGTVRGFGYDAATGRYAQTCGNYNWSAESGGVTYATATTAGGNSEYITCSGPGVGATDGGSTFNTTEILDSGTATGTTTTTVTKSGAGWTTNQWRDRLVRCTSGNCVGQLRRIASNTGTVLTLTTDRALTSTVAPTFEIYDDLGAVCWAAGERVKTNFMADAMLAQDHTTPDGEVYFPNFTGYDNGIYVDRACGRKGQGATAIYNVCPVMASPRNDHYQRVVQRIGGISWMLEGKDADLEDNGREGVWFVDDVNSLNQGTNKGMDPSDGTHEMGSWRFQSGLAPYTSTVCSPTSATDRTCNPAAILTADQMGDTDWGRVFAFANTAVMTDPARLCVSSVLATSGTCRGDRRVKCQTTGAANASMTAGCDYGAGGDIGPCEDAFAAIKYETGTRRKTLRLASQTPTLTFPEATGFGTNDADWFTVHDTVGFSCGGGIGKDIGVGVYADGGFAGWPFSSSTIQTSGLRDFIVVDYEKWYSVGGNYDGGTFSPNSYYKRSVKGPSNQDPTTLVVTNVTFSRTANPDTITSASGTPFSTVVSGDTIVVAQSDTNVDGTSNDGVYVATGITGGGVAITVANDTLVTDEAVGPGQVTTMKPGDCLSANDTDETDDEPSCDTTETLGLLSSFGGGFKNGVVGHASTEIDSQVDGSVAGFNVEFKDMVVTRGRRGLLADVSNWSMDRVLWVDNHSPSTTLVNTNFTHNAVMKNQWFKQNQANTILGLNPGRGAIYRDLIFEANDAAYGIIDMNTSGTDVLFEGLIFMGNAGNAIGIRPQYKMGNISFRNVYGYGALNFGDFSQVGKAFVSFGRHGTASYNKEVQSLSFENVKVLSSVTNGCLFMFDASAAGTNQIDINRTNISVSDSSITAINSATGQKAICVANITTADGGTNNASAANDLGVSAQQYQPIIRNVRVDGVPIPDQPYPSITAAQAGNCNPVPAGTVVRITDDTAVGACTDAGVDGVLDGGGAASSVCKCIAATNLWGPL